MILGTLSIKVLFKYQLIFIAAITTPGRTNRPGGSYVYNDPFSSDNKCLVWNSVDCILCSDFYTISNAGVYNPNSWTGPNANYDTCRKFSLSIIEFVLGQTLLGGVHTNTCMSPYPGFTDHCRVCTYFYGEVS